MANAYTDTSAMSNAVQTAYDKKFEFALRSQPLFRAIADKRPADTTAPAAPSSWSATRIWPWPPRP
jgi:hypothetical protein